MSGRRRRFTIGRCGSLLPRDCSAGASGRRADGETGPAEPGARAEPCGLTLLCGFGDSVGDRGVDHVAEQHAVVLALQRRLDHQHGIQPFGRVDPEDVLAGDARAGVDFLAGHKGGPAQVDTVDVHGRVEQQRGQHAEVRHG